MYTKFAFEYARAVRDNIYNAKFERPSLLSLVPELSGKTVLDMGCGSGEYAEILASQCEHLTAVDRSPEMVAITRERLGNRIHCYVQDLDNGLPREADSSFDIVLCPLTLHYLQHWKPILNEVHRVLKVDGLFLFSTHHPTVDFESSPSGDYFQIEPIEEEWHTIGRPILVSFYRRPLSAIFEALEVSGFAVSRFTEGKPAPELEQTHPEMHRKLSTTPRFLFFKCGKKADSR